MKKLLLSLCCFFMLHTAFSQVADTIYNYQWQSNAWEPDGRSINSYNSSCQPIIIISQGYVSSVWVNVAQTLFTYTATGKTEQTTFQTWNGSTWDNTFRITNSYNGSDLLDSVLGEIFSNNQWVSATLQTNTFNADNTINITLTQIWAGTMWFNSLRTTFSYNADKTVNQATNEIWNIFNWKTQDRDTYTYNASKSPLTVLNETFKNNKWSNNSLITNTYNGSNRITKELQQSWNSTTSLWENETQSNYTYNGDGTPSEIISQDWDKTSSTWINSSRITFHYINCILPIALLDFSGAASGNNVQLKWSTSSETNSKNFVIQRSTDGTHFTNIGTVAAGSNTTQKATYQFTDMNAVQAGTKLYYRLQMNDKDGKQAYSKIIAINITANNSFAVYPNPVKDMLNIVFSNAMQQCSLRITDQQGKAVYSLPLGTVQPGFKYQVNTSMFAKGVYYLQIISDKDVQSMKLLKN